MTYRLFLDDLREPSDIWKGERSENFVVARSFDEAMAVLASQGCPSFISFDNDLGEGQLEGYDLAKQLCELDMNGLIHIPQHFQFFVHSANCKAWDNISLYINNYLKHRNSDDLHTSSS